MQPLIYRLVCKTGLIASDHALRKTHVGRSLSSEEQTVTVFRDDTLAADDRAFFLKVRDVVEAVVSQTIFRQIAMKLQNTRDIRLTGDPVKTIEVLANRYTLNDPSALVFCGISSSKAICRGTGWSTPSRTTRRTSRTMTGPPSSRPWGASSSSWLQPSGRAWPTLLEAPGAPSKTVLPGSCPRSISSPSPGATSRLPGHFFGCQQC